MSLRTQSAAELEGIGDAAYFDRLYAGRTPTSYAGALADVVRFGQPGPILDVACGLGLVVELGRSWGLTIVGCDGSPFAVERATARVSGIDVTQVLLSEGLPYDSGRFANVLMNQVIGSVPLDVVAETLRECRRVLKPAGMLFVRSTGRASRRTIQADPTLRYTVTPSELRSLLKGAGFTIVLEPNAPLPFFGGATLRRLAERVAATATVDRLSATACAYARRD